MNRIASLSLAATAAVTAGLICTATAWAVEPTPQARLTDALLCKGDPLDIVRKMAEGGSAHFDQGFAAATFGEEMDEVNVVILKTPLDIAGAKTSFVLMGLDQAEEDFGGLVYGRFQGDYRKVVAALKLAPTPKQDDFRLGPFTKPVVKPTPDEPCPMTIALTPREDGTFLLGCGWCNG